MQPLSSPSAFSQFLCTDEATVDNERTCLQEGIELSEDSETLGQTIKLDDVFGDLMELAIKDVLLEISDFVSKCNLACSEESLLKHLLLKKDARFPDIFDEPNMAQDANVLLDVSFMSSSNGHLEIDGYQKVSRVYDRVYLRVTKYHLPMIDDDTAVVVVHELHEGKIQSSVCRTVPLSNCAKKCGCPKVLDGLENPGIEAPNGKN